MGYLSRHSALGSAGIRVLSLQVNLAWRRIEKIDSARDGLIAYHLAVVVDDFDQGITEIVRGIDLLDSTPRQIHLQRLLGYRTPAYLHIPVAENDQGQKLSKLAGAPGLPLEHVCQILTTALDALGQQPPRELAESSLDDIWSWSIKHWQPVVMARQTAIPTTEDALAWSKNGLS